MLLSALVAFSPIVVMLLLLLWWKVPADKAGVYGLVLTVVLAASYFHTSYDVLASSVLSGAVASLPVGLVLAFSIFQVSVMAEAGAVSTVAASLKALAPGQMAVQVLVINTGFGILLSGLGASTVAVLPPVLLAMGWPVLPAVLLPALGYVAFCMHALLGVPVTVLTLFAGTGLQEAGMALAAYMPVISTATSLAALYAAGGWDLLRRGFVPGVLAGLAGGLFALLLAKFGLVTVTAILVGPVIMIALFAWLRLSGKSVYNPSVLDEKDKAAISHLSLLRACSPWILLAALSLITNIPSLPFFDLIFRQWAMPVEIIPGSPEKLRILWQAYFWVMVCTLCCLPVLRVSRAQLARATAKSLQRAWRPLVATAVYFCIAYVMNHSGKSSDWTLPVADDNMILCLAHAASSTLGTWYPAAAAFLGMLGGFVAGSASSGTAMFTGVHMAAAQSIHASGVMVSAAGSVGAGLASVLSPYKLLNAAASIDRPEVAGEALKPACLIGLVLTAICALLAQFLS